MQASILGDTVHPNFSIPLGIMVRGAQMETVAPIFENPVMSDRATREWEISPMMDILSPAIFPFFSLTLIMSSRAWEGWAWMPSPALMTEAFTRFAMRWGAPEEGWRSTMTSGFMASRFLAVSMRVSPLTILDVPADMEWVSAESRLAAVSKESLVLVEGSWKKRTMVFPLRVGTFFTGRSEISFMPWAVSRIMEISRGSRDSMSRISFFSNRMA